MSHEDAPYQTNIHYCPHCDMIRTSEQVDFVRLVTELCNPCRWHCKVCGKEFDTLMPSFPFPTLDREPSEDHRFHSTE
jgi:hypothetical protein